MSRDRPAELVGTPYWARAAFGRRCVPLWTWAGRSD